MIINIRGTNGSGKSTIVRGLLKRSRAERLIYGVLGVRSPEAYELVIAKNNPKPLYILGPYLTSTGGADCIQPYDLIPGLIRKYAAKGDVVFEGVLVSKTKGQVGACLEEYGKSAVLVFLGTSLEACICSVQTRRDAKKDFREFNPHNLIEAYKSVQRVRKTFISEDKLTVLDTPREKALELVLDLLLRKRALNV